MHKYTYKVWNDGTAFPSHCYLSISQGDRVIVEREFIQPSLWQALKSTNKLVKAMLIKGEKMALARIEILKQHEIGE